MWDDWEYYWARLNPRKTREEMPKENPWKDDPEGFRRAVAIVEADMAPSGRIERSIWGVLASQPTPVLPPQPKPAVPTPIPLPLYTMPTPPVRTPIVTVPETEGSINQMLPNRGSSFNRQRLADSVAAKGATSFPTPKTKKGGMNWKAMMEAFAEQFVPEEGPSAAPGRPGPGRRPGSFKPTLAATGQGFPTGIHDMLRKKLMRGLS